MPVKEKNMNRKKAYIAPSVQVFSVKTYGMIMTSSTQTYDNQFPGDVGDGVDVNLNPGEEGDGEDAGDAF